MNVLEFRDRMINEYYSKCAVEIGNKLGKTVFPEEVIEDALGMNTEFGVMDIESFNKLVSKRLKINQILVEIGLKNEEECV